MKKKFVSLLLVLVMCLSLLPLPASAAEQNLPDWYFLSAIFKLAGSPSAKAASFSDVPASAGYAGAVSWAVEQGITSGTSAATFDPGSVCTRGQIVTFLRQALG